MPIGAGEGIRSQGLPTNLSQAVDPAPEVHRPDRHQMDEHPRTVPRENLDAGGRRCCRHHGRGQLDEGELHQAGFGRLNHALAKGGVVERQGPGNRTYTELLGQDHSTGPEFLGHRPGAFPRLTPFLDLPAQRLQLLWRGVFLRLPHGVSSNPMRLSVIRLRSHARLPETHEVRLALRCFMWITQPA